MQMKKLAILMALVSLMAGVGAASAQDGRPGRPGPGGPRGGVRVAALQILMEASIEATGLERAEIANQVRDGATLGEVITANGGDVDMVLTTALAKVTAAVDERIDRGNMTQEQGDELLARAEAGFQAALNGELSGLQRPQMMPRARIARHVLQLAAEQTGLEPQAIREQLRDGSPLADILTDNGVDPTAFIEDVMAEAEAQANARLEQLRENLTNQLNQVDADA